MAKLKQKKWMTITEAARFLTDLSDEGQITESDIIQFAMDDELTLSVRTTQQTLSPIWSAELESFEALSEEEFEQHCQDILKANREQKRVISTFVDGMPLIGSGVCLQILPPSIWDINNFGSGHRFVTRLWNGFQKGELGDPNRLLPEQPKLTNNRGDELRFTDHIELVDLEHFVIFSLPTYLIPYDSYLVVRRGQLEKLFEEDSDSVQDSELSTRQKKTYLKVIRALCEEHKDIDLGSHSTSASQVIAIADSLGLTVPGKRTLEILLKEARELED